MTTSAREEQRSKFQQTIFYYRLRQKIIAVRRAIKNTKRKKDKDDDD